MFHFVEVDREGVLILTLEGGLDATTSPELKIAIVKIAEAGRTRIVVDLTALTLVDSTGVGVLISLYKRTKALNGSVCFAGLKGQPREVFKLLRLGKTLDLVDSVEEAVTRIKSAAASA